MSGSTVIEIFGDAALQSWEGAEALIDAFLELEERTGEAPSINSINDVVYLKLKEYWGRTITVEQLKKLDHFLSRVSGKG